jgi:apolipoprotein N-acyltransferase
MALTGKDANGRSPTIFQGALLGYCSGFFWYLGNCYWIYATMHAYGGIAKPASAGILVLFCLYLGLYHALFGALVAAFRRSSQRLALLSIPFAWVAVELARARITGLPWDLLGVAQIDNPLLTRLAPFTGAYGISFVIAAVNAAWLARISLRQRRHTRTALTAVGVAVLLLYIVLVRTTQRPMPEGTQATATLVQQNIEVGAAAANAGPPLSKREMLEAFSSLSLFPPAGQSCDGIPELSSTQCAGELNHQGPANSSRSLAQSDLIVWPEAPNFFFEGDPEFRQALSHLARTTGSAIIVGDNAAIPDPADRHGYDLFNSADFIQPDGRFTGRYDKMHLVPFGEYVPYKAFFFFAGNLLADVGEFTPGPKRSVFSTGGHTYGTFICYESIFGDEIRQFQNMGAEVLVNISDDGWYGDTSAAWEHLNMVRMRAVENHRWVLRATNTGVTAAIDPFGRVVIAAPRHIRTSLRVSFDYQHVVTFYAAHGDLFAYLCAFVTLLLVLALTRRAPAA